MLAWRKISGMHPQMVTYPQKSLGDLFSSSFLYLWNFSASTPVVQKSGWSGRPGICAVLEIPTLTRACVQGNALLSPLSSSFTNKATYVCTGPCQFCNWSCHFIPVLSLECPALWFQQLWELAILLLLSQILMKKLWTHFCLSRPWALPWQEKQGLREQTFFLSH